MKRISIIVLGVIILLTLVGCETKKEEKKMKNEEDYIIVDVRTNDEYQTGHIKGAINIPYNEIHEGINLDKNKTIMVYCKSGKRSAIAYETLTKLGYKVNDLGAYDKIDMEKEK